MPRQERFPGNDVRVGVFPEREEILIGDAGFGGVALQGVGAGDAQMDQLNNSTVVFDRIADERFYKNARVWKATAH